MHNPAMLYGATWYQPGVARTGSGAWLKRAGAAGFVFFLAKGVAWLLLPALLIYRG